MYSDIPIIFLFRYLSEDRIAQLCASFPYAYAQYTHSDQSIRLNLMRLTNGLKSDLYAYLTKNVIYNMVSIAKGTVRRKNEPLILIF
jgi:hypothetical protein